MKVRDVMSPEVETCAPETDLAAAAMIMWRNDCGFVPITDDGRRAIGAITDRDICMALATRHCRAEEISARDLMSGAIHTVRADDDVKIALEKMRREKVRRLAVVGRDGSVMGVLSLNDLVLHAEAGPMRPGTDLSADQILTVMKALCEHQGASDRIPVHA
jgi:CBS domain-containing protein